MSPNISLSGGNARLSYKLSGARTASLRCTRLSLSYGVNSEESHARRYRAFYPHLRVQGSFSMTFEFIHWKEYEHGMMWFRDYISALLAAREPSPMLVRMDSRDFVRLALPTTGATFGDHTASMVFAPTITFISVADPRDSRSSIVKSSDASHSTLPARDTTATQWFYPESKLNHPGQLQSYIYDQAQQAAAQRAASVQNTINSGPVRLPGGPVLVE